MRASDFISIAALICSIVVPIFIFSFEKYSDEFMPKRERSVICGYTDTIYVSRFNKPHDIVLDICHRVKNELTNPEMQMMSDSLKQVIVSRVNKEAKYKRSTLYVLDANSTKVDSIVIQCADCNTIGITVPQMGSVVLDCVKGFLNNFCSYQFIKL